ncbi:MAG: elongation factor G, partial [Anaerolineales bacterium]|nr:elongation factor G [Anaerolineales bacterium]
QIRNVVLAGHNGAGKTIFVERALFNTGATSRLGKVENGTAAMDFEAEEVERGSSISTALAAIEWRDHKINLLDTPGFIDFIGEVNSAIKVADGALILVEAVSGVEVGTELAWQATEQKGMPRVVLVSKMDRDNVRVARVMTSITENLQGNFVPLQIPIGEGPTFKGVVDLLSMESRLGDDDSRGPIPDDLVDAAEEARMAVIEAAAEGDDELMEKFFENDTLPDEDIVRGLRLAMLQGLCVPVLYAAPQPGIAVVPALNALYRLLPAPDRVPPPDATDANGNVVEIEVSDNANLAAFVFKTREDTYGRTSYIRVFGGSLESDSRVWDANLDSEVRVGSLQVVTGKDGQSVARLHSGDIGSVVKLGDTQTNHTLCDRGHKLNISPIEQPNPIASVAIHPVSQSDVAKLNQSIHRLIIEDPTLTSHTESATHENILSGMGITHLEVAVKKAKSKFGVNITTTTPKVPYRETITQTSKADYTHKKQTGGAGQYGKVYLRVESIDVNEQFEFASEIFGGAISAPFVAATEKGCRQALEGGVLAGYPVYGVKAVVYDGKEHPVDSKEIAFQTAGRECFKIAVMEAKPVLLEPLYNVTVTVPSDYMGDIMGDMNTRRATIQGVDSDGNKSIVKALVPQAEMLSYAADLRSMTQGRGIFSMTFEKYERVPNHLQESLVKQLKAQRDHEEG